MNYMELIKAGKEVTLKAILQAIDANDWNVLYYATEAQICTLIDDGKIDEDFYSRRDDYQEELRCMARHGV